MNPIAVMLAVVGAYLGAGLVFACVFVARGVQRIDPAAVGTSWPFRLLILPGVAALWPVLLRRWVRGEVPPGPADPRRGRVEGTRRVLHGAGAWWAVVLLGWFVLVMAQRLAGGGP